MDATTYTAELPATEDYAVITHDTLMNGRRIWVARVFFKGRKRYQVIDAASEGLIRSRCRALGATDIRTA